VLFIVTVGSVIIHTLFLKNERHAFIDQQVREAASALVDSQLSDLRKFDFAQAEDIISEELGETRIGKFFIIRNANGEIIFESASAKLLPLTDIPRDKQWIQINVSGKFIRVLNLQLPRLPDRMLQVGLVLDENIISPKFITKSSLIFILFVLVFGMVTSYFLTSFILKPVAKLESFITDVTKNSKSYPKLPNLPATFLKYSSAQSKDEFHCLVVGLNSLIEIVNKNYRFSRLWAYQMAHELKTPISILRLELEHLQKNIGLTEEQINPSIVESNKISETISSFLGWAELENSNQQRNLFVNHLSQFIKSVSRRFADIADARIITQIENDIQVIATPQHLEQLIINLLSNALNYSDTNKPVTINIKNQSLIITDYGPGLPKEVLDRIGEPFNRGGSDRANTNGHGLGLAWVKSICHLYSWVIEFNSSSNGTEIKIIFPKTIEDSQVELAQSSSPP
jgi:two-component system sensor histidine kinase QseC